MQVTVVDWSQDVPAQNAALDLAMKLKIKSCLTEFQIAEFIMLAQHSFWYVQMKNVAEDSNHLMREGALLLKTLVDSGYNPETKMWWDIMTVFPVKETMARAMRHMASYIAWMLAEHKYSTNVVSQGFPIIARILFGPQYLKVMAIAVAKPDLFEKTYIGMFNDPAPQDSSMYHCINPFCNKMVNRREKKSGACCREHMSYRCTHPECVKKAALTEWGYQTHSYASKIGKAHLDYRKGGPKDPDNKWDTSKDLEG